MQATDKQKENKYAWRWKPGQSGNPKGRPKGQSLKEFAREYLLALPDDEKKKFLSALPPEIAWRMAEGNPANNTDITSKGEKIEGNNIILTNFKDAPTGQ